MGLCNSPDIFQEKMSELFVGLDTVRVYIDDLFLCYKRLLDITYYCPQRDVHPPPEVWAQGQRQKIMLWRPQIWLFGLSRHLCQSYAHTKEVKAIQALAVPKTRKQLCQLMGLCNSPKNFQGNMSEIFVGLDTVRVYIDELLHVINGSWT